MHGFFTVTNSSPSSIGNDIVVPSARRILFLLPQGVNPRDLLPSCPATARQGRVFYTTSFPHKQFQFGVYRLRWAETRLPSILRPINYRYPNSGNLSPRGNV